MENLNPISATIINPETPQEEFQPTPKSNKLLYVVLGLVLICFVGFAGFLIGQHHNEKERDTPPDLSNALLKSPSTPIPQKQVDKTGDWQIYSNSELTFKYPSNWTYEEMNIKILSLSPKIDIYITAKDSNLMNECMQLDTIEEKNGLVIKYFSRVTTGEMCASDDPGPREIWIIPTLESYRPGISYQYSADDQIEAKRVFDQILSTFKFLDDEDQTQNPDLASYKALMTAAWQLVDSNYSQEMAIYLQSENGPSGSTSLEGELWTIPEEIRNSLDYDFTRDFFEKLETKGWQQKTHVDNYTLMPLIADGPTGGASSLIALNRNSIRTITVSENSFPMQDHGLKFQVFVSNIYSIDDLLQLVKLKAN